MMSLSPSEYRGQGLARLLFDQVETIAKARGCCKLTLEVLKGNERARAAYTKFGFSGYELDPEMGAGTLLGKETLMALSAFN